MPRKMSLTPPLLYVVQPEFQKRESKAMQTRYHTKIGKAKQEIAAREDDNLNDVLDGPEQTSAFVENALKDSVEEVALETERPRAGKTEVVIESEHEDSRDKKARKPMNEELMQFFVQSLKSNVQEVKEESIPQKDQNREINNSDQELSQNDALSTEKAKNAKDNEEVRRLISRLSRYPDFVEKPLCEAVVRGEKIQLKIDKKRGDQVRVLINSKKEILNIEDITELIIL